MLNRPLPAPARDIAMLIARVILGVVLFAHGWQKLMINGISETYGQFEKLGIPLAIVSASFTSFVEFVGGVLIILGALTTTVVALDLIVMVGAAGFVHITNGIFAKDGGWELVGVIVAVELALAAFGPGRYSVDDVVARRRDRERADLERRRRKPVAQAAGGVGGLHPGRRPAAPSRWRRVGSGPITPSSGAATGAFAAVGRTRPTGAFAAVAPAATRLDRCVRRRSGRGRCAGCAPPLVFPRRRVRSLPFSAASAGVPIGCVRRGCVPGRPPACSRLCAFAAAARSSNGFPTGAGAPPSGHRRPRTCRELAEPRGRLRRPRTRRSARRAGRRDRRGAGCARGASSTPAPRKARRARALAAHGERGRAPDAVRARGPARRGRARPLRRHRAVAARLHPDDGDAGRAADVRRDRHDHRRDVRAGWAPAPRARRRPAARLGGAALRLSPLGRVNVRRGPLPTGVRPRWNKWDKPPTPGGR